MLTKIKRFSKEDNKKKTFAKNNIPSSFPTAHNEMEVDIIGWRQTDNKQVASFFLSLSLFPFSLSKKKDQTSRKWQCKRRKRQRGEKPLKKQEHWQKFYICWQHIFVELSAFSRQRFPVRLLNVKGKTISKMTQIIFSLFARAHFSPGL